MTRGYVRRENIIEQHTRKSMKHTNCMSLTLFIILVTLQWKWAAACMGLMELRSVRRVRLNTVQHMQCKHRASDTPSSMAALFTCSEHPLHSNLCQRSSQGAQEATIHPSIHLYMQMITVCDITLTTRKWRLKFHTKRLSASSK